MTNKTYFQRGIILKGKHNNCCHLERCYFRITDFIIPLCNAALILLWDQMRAKSGQ